MVQGDCVNKSNKVLQEPLSPRLAVKVSNKAKIVVNEFVIIVNSLDILPPIVPTHIELQQQMHKQQTQVISHPYPQQPFQLPQ